MYPPKFEYDRASTVDQALSLLAANPDAKLLAGGHSLLPVMKLRLADPGHLIDIGEIDELRGITVLRDGGVEIGALTTHAMVAANRDVPRALSEAAGRIGDPQVRNRGTVGGNIAHADPASDLPTVFVALNADINIAGRDGRRRVSADDFFTGLFETALRDGEIVVSVRVPALRPGAMSQNGGGIGSAYAKFANPASRYAMLGAAAALTVRDGRIGTASVAVGSLTPTAVRARSVENALRGQGVVGLDLEAVAANVDADLGDDVIGDIHASADYRRAMAPVFVRRALAAAIERAA